MGTEISKHNLTHFTLADVSLYTEAPFQCHTNFLKIIVVICIYAKNLICIRTHQLEAMLFLQTSFYDLKKKALNNVVE